MATNFNAPCEALADRQIDDANAIFFAQVTKEYEGNAFLEVERVWRGEVPRDTWTQKNNLIAEEGDASGSLVGNSYLIYGTPHGSVDGFYAYPCVSQMSTLEEARALLGPGEEPREFVATFDAPFPKIDGSHLGIADNGYLVFTVFALLAIGFIIGIWFATILGLIFSRLSK